MSFKCPAVRTLSFCAAMLALVNGSAFAQRSQSTLSQLMGDRVRGELQLSDDQVSKLEAISQSVKPDTKKLLSALREAKDSKARTEIRSKFTSETAAKRVKAGTEALAVLTPSQRSTFRRVLIRDNGVNALLQPAFEGDLKLSDSQKEQIKQGLSDRAKEIREKTFGADRDKRDTVREEVSAEWDKKLLGMLNEDQKKFWEANQASPQAAQTAGASSQGAGSASSGGSGGETPVVASFGAPSTVDGKTAKAEKLSFNFSGAPWETVLTLFADSTGLTLDLHSIPQGSFTHIDRNEYEIERALDIVNGYLLREGYLTVEKDNFLISWAFDDGIPPSLVPEVTVEELMEEYANVDNQLLTVAFKIEGGDVEQIAREIDLRLGPYPFVRIAALTGSNRIVVTDLSVNLRRVKALIDESGSKVVTKAFPIQYMVASQAEVTIRRSLGMPPSALDVSEARGRGNSQSSFAAGLNITADDRTNNLLVVGTQEQLSKVEELLNMVDSDKNAAGDSIGFLDMRPQLVVYTLKASNPSEVAKTINQLIPGKIINEDVRARKLHIKATRKEHEEIADMIAKLDGAGADGSVLVYHLSDMDAMTANQMLTTMFSNEAGGGPVIQSDQIEQRLIVRGTAEQIDQIKTVLGQLGETGQRMPKKKTDRGPLMRLPMGGRSGQEVIKALEQMMRGPRRNIIRVVPPRQSNPIKGAVQPGLPSGPSLRESMDAAERQPVRRRRETTARQRSGNISYTAMFQQEGNSKEAELVNRFDEFFGPGSDDGGSQPQETVGDPQKPEVMLTYQGDTLIVVSEDPNALQEVENMMELLNQTMPVQTTWTIFYLTSADATEAAAMLEQMFPASSVGTGATTGGGGMMDSLASGLSSFGSSVMDMTGLNTIGMGPQTLRIIPETRSNALYVAGPEYLVQEVSDVLKVLDLADIPLSARDLVAREPIHLNYADASAAADLLKEVFKPFTEVQRSNSRQQNPMAAMFGGGGGGNSNNPASKVRLTIAVDQNTNDIYVACSEALYQQVSAKCREMDDRARMANPGVRVLTLKSASAVQAANILSSMLPRAMQTAPTRSRSGSSSSSSSNDAARAAQEAAARRAAIFGGGGFGRGTTGGTTFGRGATGRGGATGGRTGGRGGAGGGRTGGRGR